MPQFLDLPGALRNQIYAEIFAPLEPRLHYQQDWQKTAPRLPAITRTCRQLRAESRPLFLARTEVHLSGYFLYRNFRGLALWISEWKNELAGLEDIKHLKSVKLSIGSHLMILTVGRKHSRLVLEENCTIIADYTGFLKNVHRIQEQLEQLQGNAD